jgi:DNA-binding FadR family transcriptional regulator
VDSESTQEQGQQSASRSVATQIRRGIDNGTYPVDTRLPSYRDLAATFDVAVNTVREAMRLLEQDGRVELRDRSGAYVRAAETPTPVEQLRQAGDALATLREQLKGALVTVTEVERQVEQAMNQVRPTG